ncbi:hypothetical protein CN140_04280 [Sinorhizobium meliloti]|uniref:hypothetical protein n=1 Tax=Rhizobium meliloti TaxID=382 RepID=UPI000FD7BEB2|nr:hypothetical protein [Sinorhizobium meliloti]RVL86735.1 hypothetical protein CN140_04280 [Sinorhizobium meliloti]
MNITVKIINNHEYDEGRDELMDISVHYLAGVRQDDDTWKLEYKCTSSRFQIRYEEDSSYLMNAFGEPSWNEGILWKVASFDNNDHPIDTPEGAKKGLIGLINTEFAPDYDDMVNDPAQVKFIAVCAR